MNKKFLILTLVLSLAFLSSVSASDVNETVIVDDQYLIEEEVVCEDEIVDVSLISQGNEVIPEEETLVGEIIDNESHTTSFEIVNINCIKEESNFVTDNFEAPIIGFNDSQFFDINIELFEEFGAAFNNTSNISFIEINFSFDDLGSFEVFMIKLEDFDSTLFKEGKFKNSFTVKHELRFYVFHEKNFDNYLNLNIIGCGNKLTDNFVYSINNSIIGDECSVIYCIFNSSYCLFFNCNSYCVSISCFCKNNQSKDYNTFLNFGDFK